MAKYGRGISELLANLEDSRTEVSSEDKIYSLPIGSIEANPLQPRKNFNEDALNDLATSIAEHGIIQPLVLTKKGDKYLIVAGERRFRAAQMAGLTEVPAVVRKFSEQTSREVSLIENLQREDLNAIESAKAMKELMDTYRLTQEELARRIGKARPSIANTLRLLLLDEEVQNLVRDGKLSAGHARTLIPVSNVEDQIKFALEAIEKQMSVRDLERKVRFYISPEKEKKVLVKTNITPEMRELVDDMKRVFMTKVKLVGNQEKGRIMIDYFSKGDLQRVYELINSLKTSDFQ